MGLSALTALSPLDGRYAAKLATLRPFMSEFGYMHRRVQVEIAWFIALSDTQPSLKILLLQELMREISSRLRQANVEISALHRA